MKNCQEVLFYGAVNEPPTANSQLFLCADQGWVRLRLQSITHSFAIEIVIVNRYFYLSEIVIVIVIVQKLLD